MFLTDALRYAIADPTTFKTGDIVEAQFTFAAVPVKGDNYRLMMVLRALTLLDCFHTMVRVNEIHCSGHANSQDCSDH